MLGKSRAPYDLYRILSQEQMHMGCRVPIVLTRDSDRIARIATAASVMRLLETATKTDHQPHKWASPAEVLSLDMKRIDDDFFLFTSALASTDVIS